MWIVAGGGVDRYPRKMLSSMRYSRKRIFAFYGGNARKTVFLSVAAMTAY